ncbi:hypothetical protein EYF80_064260 [Liparis tanakae]|uniref:Uncharacterized protein n=1 Tax=Liparis tanakae TaxID=230148 RepID=A0A4Z2E9X3_9TELE|nr:hypothetical protein EYF80_064260 [Liparis tanakae]
MTPFTEEEKGGASSPWVEERKCNVTEISGEKPLRHKQFLLFLFLSHLKELRRGAHKAGLLARFEKGNLSFR